MKAQKENQINKLGKKPSWIPKQPPFQCNDRSAGDTQRPTPRQSLYAKLQQVIQQQIQHPAQHGTSHSTKGKDKATETVLKEERSQSSESYNIWGEGEHSQTEDKNIFWLYEQRTRELGGDINSTPERVVANVRRLLGMKFRLKNMGSYPWFTHRLAKDLLYYLPLSKQYKIRKASNTNNRAQKCQYSQNEMSKLRQMNSPEILKTKLLR